ncbi:hypothetical protein [Halegenticoccus soli]|uniref:hypothetical protein n=1 Tax=Halegenticoccus soli TaxID=1985678 RepID=UPI000C6EF744|nr:hypothetical protein [Halegenticoccus soli]
MYRPPLPELALLSIRRTLGVSLVLYAFYLGLHYLSGYPFLTPTDVVTVLALVFAGTWLGIGFSLVAPLPEERGLPRVVRTILLTVPALGIGVALQIFLKGARSDMALYAIFALAAWLGSTFVREEGSDESHGGTLRV